MSYIKVLYNGYYSRESENRISFLKEGDILKVISKIDDTYLCDTPKGYVYVENENAIEIKHNVPKK
jgi:hypothetical protein